MEILLPVPFWFILLSILVYLVRELFRGSTGIIGPAGSSFTSPCFHPIPSHPIPSYQYPHLLIASLSPFYILNHDKSHHIYLFTTLIGTKLKFLSLFCTSLFLRFTHSPLHTFVLFPHIPFLISFLTLLPFRFLYPTVRFTFLYF